MKIRTKILMLFTLGVVVPLLLSHFFSMRLFSTSIRKQAELVLVHQTTQAAGRLTDASTRFIDDVHTAADSVPFDRLTGEQLQRALSIPYRQIAEATIVALIDESGRAIVAPFFEDEKQALAMGRSPVVDDDLVAFSKNIPLSLALQAEVAVGPIYKSSKGDPRVAIARAVRLSEGGPRWVFTAELSLGGICARVREAGAPEGFRVSLFDLSKQTICGGYKDEELPVEIESIIADGSSSRYVDKYGGITIAAAGSVEGTGWTLVMEQSEEIVLAPVIVSVSWAGFWAFLSLVIAIAGGFVIARGLSDPIVQLATAASKIADGDYEQRLRVTSRDEVGGLADTFNRMTGEIQKWNDELVKRVEERTEELREAHEQVIQTQKLAAIGELGSGVAHEVNNPLAAVIGMAQLLQCDPDINAQTNQGLEDIVTSARRVADVVDSLLRFSQTQLPSQQQTIVAAELIEEVLELFASRFEERHVVLNLEMDKNCKIYATANDLKLALSQVIDNALRAVGAGGQLGVTVGKIEGGVVRIVIFDNGSGMTNTVRTRAFEPFFTTNDPGSGSKGMGLPLVHRIVSEHKGRIVLKSEIDSGTTVKIYIPGATRLSRQV